MHNNARSLLGVITVVLCLPTLILLAGFTAAEAQGRSQGRGDVAGRARGAERVVVATIGSVETMAAQNQYGDQLIISRATLILEETLKGPWTPTATIDVEGGTLGGLTLEVSDLPSVRPGERGVFFVRRSAPGRNIPHQRGKGILKLDQNNRVEDSNLTLEDIRREVDRGSNGRGNQ